MINRARKLVAVGLTALLALAVTAQGAIAAPAPQDTDGATLVVTDTYGIDKEVNAKQLQEIVDAGALQLNDEPGKLTRAHSQWEGKTFRSLKLYFNKSETSRIAAGSGLCLTIISSIPMAAPLKPACLGLTVYATSAVALGKCVGMAKSPVPLTPYPIYHQGKWCK